MIVGVYGIIYETPTPPYRFLPSNAHAMGGAEVDKWDMTQREIKFRVWDGNFMDYNPRIGFLEGVYTYSINAEFLEPPEGTIYMQFTGLKDKNNKPIFEGDVVKWKDSHGRLCTNIVEWESDITGFGPFVWIDPDCETHCKPSNIEVIGNVFENPELLVQSTK